MSAMILYSLLLAFLFIKTQKLLTVISKKLFQFIRECKCIVIAENVRYVLINLIRYLLNMFDVCLLYTSSYSDTRLFMVSSYRQ